jgi:hypothetical protein
MISYHHGDTWQEAIMSFTTIPWDPEFLRDHGIQETTESVLQILRRAIEAFPQPSAADAAHELSQSELDAMAAVGLDIHATAETTGGTDVDTVAEMAALVATSYSVKEVASRLGVDPSRVRQRLTRDHSLYGFHWENEWRIPRFQFADGGTLLPHLKDVVQVLPEDLHPLAVHRWFTSDCVDLWVDELERTASPKQWLLRGEPLESLLHIAKNLV